MMQFQVRPKDAEESERVQDALFKLGYHWSGEDGCVSSNQHHPALLCFSDGLISSAETYDIADRFLGDHQIANIGKIIAVAEKREQEKMKSTEPEVSTPSPVPLSPEEEEKAMREAMARPEFQQAMANLSALFGGMLAPGMPGPDMKPAVKEPDEDDEEKKSFDEFWIVWNSSRTGAPKLQHFSESEAWEEAERLSKKQPGERFYVLRSEKAYESVAVVQSKYPRIAQNNL